MCHSHSVLSNAMSSQLLSLPSGFCRVTVILSPVDLHLVLVVSFVSSGSSALRLLTIAFRRVSVGRSCSFTEVCHCSCIQYSLGIRYVMKYFSDLFVCDMVVDYFRHFYSEDVSD